MKQFLPRVHVELAISKVDKTGRVYIPGDLREALGIGPNEVVEVNVEGERLILERKKSSVSAKGRGLFKLKIPVIENILAREKADKVLLGGVPAKLFLRARQIETKIDDGEIRDFKQFLDRAKDLTEKYRDQIEVPLDLAYEDKQGKRIDQPVTSTRIEQEALDIGSKTLEKYSKIVVGAATTVANGPL